MNCMRTLLPACHVQLAQHVTLDDTPAGICLPGRSTQHRRNGQERARHLRVGQRGPSRHRRHDGHLHQVLWLGRRLHCWQQVCCSAPVPPVGHLPLGIRPYLLTCAHLIIKGNTLAAMLFLHTAASPWSLGRGSPAWAAGIGQMFCHTAWWPIWVGRLQGADRAFEAGCAGPPVRHQHVAAPGAAGHERHAGHNGGRRLRPGCEKAAAAAR